MKYINMENWPRSKHFQFFNQLDYPHFNVGVNVELTTFHNFIKNNNISLFKALLYTVIKTANEFKEFRQRIQGGKVIEYDVVNPSFTTMGKDELFSFCNINYTDDFKAFYKLTEKAMNEVMENPIMEDIPYKDDIIYITSLPWISFTSMSHPIHFNPIDSIPRIAWSKFYKENEIIKLPISVQVHHALMDGFHVSKFILALQENLNNPSKILT